MSKKSVRIGNCSGYLGDNLDAAMQLVEHGNIDVLTGDYLAELTMAVLKGWRDGGKRAAYADGFLAQLEQIADACKERGIKIVVNAGGLEPGRMADDAKELLTNLGVDMKVAYVDGDELKDRVPDLMAAGEELAHMDDEDKLESVLSDSTRKVGSANAYLGMWGPTEALRQGAELVITGRGMDAASVMAAAADHHGWGRHDYDKLAGALAAGHAIECGTQVTGGNFSGFDEVPDFNNMGYGIAEIFEDGSADITMPQAKGIGGMVSVDTVTAQLLYEIRKNEYFGPDVIPNLATGSLEQKEPNVVHMSGFRGKAPTNLNKVCINIDSDNPDYTPKPKRKRELSDTFNLSAKLGLTGLDIEAKAALYNGQLRKLLENTGYKYTDVKAEITGNPGDTYQFLEVTATTDSKEAMRAFNAAKFSLLLSTFPGAFFPQTVNLGGEKITTHWPAMVNGKHITEQVHIDGEVIAVPPTSQLESYNADEGYQQQPLDIPEFVPIADEAYDEIPLGRLFHTRSGDKGGNANIGVWTQDEELYAYLCHHMTPEKLRELLPANMIKDFEIERHDFPNLGGVNFFIKGILGQGVSSNDNVDQQAKALGELLGAQSVAIPRRLIPEHMKQARAAPAPALAV